MVCFCRVASMLWLIYILLCRSSRLSSLHAQPPSMQLCRASSAPQPSHPAAWPVSTSRGASLSGTGVFLPAARAPKSAKALAPSGQLSHRSSLQSQASARRSQDTDRAISIDRMPYPGGYVSPRRASPSGSGMLFHSWHRCNCTLLLQPCSPA